MFDAWNDPETLWLNVTNAVLGVLVLACVALIAGAVAVEVGARLKARWAARRLAADTHAFVVPGLGVTMADGGAPVKPASEKKENGRA